MNEDLGRAAQEVLGYLNFSSGSFDPKFLRNVNHLFQAALARNPGTTAWLSVRQILEARLTALEGSSAAFADVNQARQVLALAGDHALPEYRRFHRDLLFHQTDDFLFQPLFVGRVFEAVLRQGPPWSECERITSATIRELNDFVGYRPVAILNTAAKIEPYPHERVRPIPIYIAGVGPGAGPYAKLIARAIDILNSTDRALLRETQLDPALIDELAVDPRAYDFDHPVNKRTNYQFGEWDPHVIDNRGHYRRFVLRQLTLDTILSRVAEAEPAGDDFLFEGAAVLAGVMLMASGMTGNGPEAHDSSVTLATLIPRIAKYRDAFYEKLLESLSGELSDRLRGEAQRLHQPFAGARQHLNYQIARYRAEQLQRMALAALFARMGYPDAARRQTRLVPVASARMKCEMTIRFTAASQAIERGALAQAATLRDEIEDLAHRGIECGALVDPWNILGFQGNFSIFPAIENTVRDHRVDELINLVRQILSLDGRIECEAAIAGDHELRARMQNRHKRFADWWDQFATADVGGVEHVIGSESCRAASRVASALAAAHQAGAEAGKLAFWRQHVASFKSPKAYAMVVAVLIERGQWSPAMALLMQWLSARDSIPLEQGEFSFHELAVRWMSRVLNAIRADLPGEIRGAQDQWNLIRRFFDFAEANAEAYWHSPRGDSSFAVGSQSGHDQETEDLFGAAYEGMTYRDSTKDGFEGSLLESGPETTNAEWEEESRLITQHLRFLYTMARLWKMVAVTGILTGDHGSRDERQDRVAAWLKVASDNERGLQKLLQSVHARQIPQPTGARESLLEFDRRRTHQLALMDRIATTAIATADAVRYLDAASASSIARSEDWEAVAAPLTAAILRRDLPVVRQRLAELHERIQAHSLLYRPLAAGGDPHELVQAQKLQHLLIDLSSALPRLGLLRETCELIVVAQTAELAHPIGRSAVSEFDRLFRVAFTALVQSIADAARQWSPDDNAEAADAKLIECIEPVTEKMLKRWLLHSRSLRLSVLERVMDDKDWSRLVKFIQRYGRDLFTQPFFHAGNLRSILHQGVDQWLSQLRENESASPPALLDEIGHSVSREEAVQQLELILEAVLEHYPEYQDYNHIATQSDRGEMLFVLLDFLRLKVRYERVAWNLRPVFLAHDVLVRSGWWTAAELWQRTFQAKTQEAADWHQKRFVQLVETYGIKLPSVADRLGERFVRPLALDRIRALVAPAMGDARRGVQSASFVLFEQEIGRLTEEPTGAGLDVPSWLQSLEREVYEAEKKQAAGGDRQEMIPQAPIRFQEVAAQIDGWQPDDS